MKLLRKLHKFLGYTLQRYDGDFIWTEVCYPFLFKIKENLISKSCEVYNDRSTQHTIHENNDETQLK